jgi:hypothetical protein
VQRLGSRIVTYADDLVILCKKGKADQALQQLRKIMSKLKLTVRYSGRCFSDRSNTARIFRCIR